MAKNKQPLHPDAPLLLNDHRRPVSRRELISQGFKLGGASLVTGSMFGFFANSASAQQTVQLSSDLVAARQACGIAAQGNGKIPFIAFDLAGGANFAGSNVLIGQRGGQLDYLSAAGYSKQGLPADMTPNLDSATNVLVNQELGLRFHATSAVLKGILSKVAVGNRANVNGAVIAARSENDTANNPHNPMYYIAKAGAGGSLVDLIGSRASDSGGNSMSSMSLVDMEFQAKYRPTKVDNPNDVTGLVDVGDLAALMEQEEIVRVMESTYRISNAKLGQVSPGTGDSVADAKIIDGVNCAYVKGADLAARFGNPSAIDPVQDADIVGATGIFSNAEFSSDGEFRKTASVMKMVINGYAAAGTITMGGYDYHTGDRSTGEIRDERLGVCIGAVLEYAARIGTPVMIYVFSDGSVFSNGMLDNSMAGGGKGVWTGDDQQTASSFILVYNPGRRPVLIGGTSADPLALTAEQLRHQQIGYMRPSGDVETASSPAGNNVNLLAETVVLNYMALHGDQANFGTLFRGQGLGSSTMQDRLTAFQPICNGTIQNPV
jgi:hypothetical protein